ncbi:MAG TPA: aromatic ring-hydroxylating dioxygenase subunit alpha, partial [Stellaceae bacterium]|nr:aromatic ring-hydroxylating dioxygenase subunit alpha [Stellaceae bacterium]
DAIPSTAAVRAYPVVERNEIVWIWMGEPERADSTAIVEYPFNDDYANWPHKREVYALEANYLLVLDNLMDLTHLAYVHRRTVGGNPSAHVNARMTSTPTERGVQFSRWLLDCAPPATYAKAVRFSGNVDRWQEFEFVAPGTVLQWTGATDAGTGADEGRREGGFSLRIFHGVTPETEGSCHYFWSAANGYSQDDPGATDRLFEEIAATFMEDKALLAEQQASLAESGETGLVDIKADVARIQMRRVIRRLIEAEASRPGPETC